MIFISSTHHFTKVRHLNGIKFIEIKLYELTECIVLCVGYWQNLNSTDFILVIMKTQLWQTLSKSNNQDNVINKIRLFVYL